MVFGLGRDFLRASFKDLYRVVIGHRLVVWVLTLEIATPNTTNHPQPPLTATHLVFCLVFNLSIVDFISSATMKICNFLSDDYNIFQNQINHQLCKFHDAVDVIIRNVNNNSDRSPL